MKRFIAIAAAILIVSAARDAAAQVFVNPFVDTTLTSPTGRGGSSKAGFGAAFGNIGKIVGAETEVAYYPELLNNGANAVAKSKVVTFSGGTLIGPTLGRIKPYGAFGFGGLYLNVTSVSSIVVPNPASISNTYFTFNAGGGVMGFFSTHFGVRGDLRYFRAYGFKLDDLQNAGLAFDRIDFWRAGIGLAAKF
jgi:hypothetical protein